MSAADHTINTRLIRRFATWGDGIVTLTRRVQVNHPLAVGMRVDFSRYGVPDPASIEALRHVDERDPDVELEVTLNVERGDGDRMRVAGLCDWKRHHETKEETTK